MTRGRRRETSTGRSSRLLATCHLRSLVVPLLLLASLLLPGCRAHVPVPDARNLITSGVAPGCLTLENRTGDLVCYVYVSQEPRAWGDDRLAPAEVIDPNSARHFHVGEGTWRVRAEDCSRRGVFQRDALVVGPEGVAVRLFARE